MTSPSARDLSRGRLGSPRRLVLEGHDQVDAVSGELARRGVGRVLVRQVPPVQAQVLALLVPQHPQRLAQRVERRRDVVQAHVEHADPVHLPRGLRLGGMGRGEESEDHDRDGAQGKLHTYQPSNASVHRAAKASAAPLSRLRWN